MMNKNSLFFGMLAGTILSTTFGVMAAEVLRPEDEHLLVEETAVSAPRFVKPIEQKPVVVKPVQVETVQIHEPEMARKQNFEDQDIASLRTSIDACLDLRENQLNVELSMYEQEKNRNNLAYISQTLQDINLCYEDIGAEIIEKYYDSDVYKFAAYHKKAKSFYVRATDASFDARFCGKNCSMNAVFEAQIAKFAEFRAYLNELLDERPLKK
ncbi:MAG: hypothetical protein NC218_07055 [Acetobacter sp.]|nr:hypothetical protein [Acetobacter sp.]